MPAPQIIQDLVARFEYNRDAYRNPQYNETQLRREFLDPFFTALGWDVNNEQGYAEAYKDVVHEDAIKIGGASKAPDYCFRIGGTRKFFVEAKKPAVNLKDDPKPAFQLRRYAWSAKLPLSILSDFEEFAVYDCRIQPNENDKPAIARTLYIPCTEYAARWDEIEAVFSRNAILKGAFDKYAADNKTRRGTAEVDAAFLKEIETWRESLAKNIALRNPDLRNRELNFAVQIIIDRLIFLRICEDRGIELYGILQQLLNGKDVYARLLHLFREADERYNSGLFHFRIEKGRDDAGLDTITPRLSVDDKTLKDILSTLYYPCPYEFSVLPADILGQVYEQFLGKVIRLDSRHRAVVEDKPEVKKAGGVYYTPTYIVDYITAQTVGKLLEGKTPKQVEKLKILDPACGSGSFLIGAYQRLLDWHQQWYETDGPAKHAKGKDARLYQGAGGAWRLTTGERKRILLANLYGVDIDPQAVEVTKLSLLLKMLEGETQQTVNATLSMFQERVLPDLDANIQCGNSLIGPDFYDGKQLTLLDEDEMYRVNVFDWKKAFPKILTGDNPGFDAIIGNPPYGAWFNADEAQYFGNHYEAFSGVKDVYTFFIEKGIELLQSKGTLSFIVPSAWIGGPDYAKLRSLLLSNSIEVLIMLPFDVFANAYIDTAIIVLSKAATIENHVALTYVFPKRERLSRIGLQPQDYQQVNQGLWKEAEGQKFVLHPGTIALLQNIKKQTLRIFSDVVEMKRGVLFNKILLTDSKVSEESHHYFEGDVYRYNINLVVNHWIEFNDKLTERPKEFRWFENNRILLRRLVNRKQRLMAVATTESFITNKNLYSLLPRNLNADINFVLGILNSRLVSFLYIQQVTQAVKDDFPQVTIKDVLSLPFPNETATNKARHDRMVNLVEQMLRLHQQMAGAAPTTRTVLQRQIEVTDQQIDRLVYEVYGLTPDEIAMVENAG